VGIRLGIIQPFRVCTHGGRGDTWKVRIV
jgi:hypothetical protein